MKSKNYNPKVLLRYLIITVAVFTVIHLTLQYININYLNEQPGNFHELSNRFDFDDEASIPTWFSQLLFLGLAFFAALIAYIERKKKQSYWVWVSVAVIATLGSIDEVSTVHESGLQGLHLIFFNENTPTILANAWIVILPAVLAFFLLFAYKANKVLPSRTLKLFILAVAIYLSGAVGVDILTSSLESLDLFIKQGVFVSIEEAMELLGLSLAIFATTDYLSTHYSRKVSTAVHQLRK